MSLKTMYKAAALALALLLCGAAAFAEAADEESLSSPGAEVIDLYTDVWVMDGFAAEIWYEGEWFKCRAVQGNGEGDSVIREYNHGFYVDAEDALIFGDSVRYREHYDSLSDELVQEDWALNDMAFAVFRLSDTGSELIASDIEGFDAPLVLQRLSDAEEEDYLEAQAFLGRWVCGRASIEVSESDTAYRFVVSRTDSASEQTEWTYLCAYYGEDREMRNFEGGEKRIVTRAGEGGIADSSKVYGDGEAVFTMDDDGFLHWDDRLENAGESMAFERAGIAASE